MPLSYKIIRTARVEEGEQASIKPVHLFSPAEKQAANTQQPPEPEFDWEEERQKLLQQAEETLRQARSEAESIIDAARREAGSLLEQARQQAAAEALAEKEKARQQGRQEVMSKAMADATVIREQARQVLRQAEEIYRQRLDALAGDIIELAQQIAEKLVHQQLDLHPETVLATAQAAIELLRQQEQLVLYVPPQEIALYRENLERLQRLLPPGSRLSLLADGALSPGESVLESAHGRVDAGWEARWQAIREILEGNEQ
ncbi:FliH/SctL family protein [Desulfurispora thermophila]|uniref:FliH/SctL family protein n=1 Tax=Desulfurispora thermophila TaxID=265470 RepID=UPI000369869C|nr:FliH/SctL family protein [Desulfurispora thermophila]